MGDRRGVNGEMRVGGGLKGGCLGVVGGGGVLFWGVGGGCLGSD